MATPRIPPFEEAVSSNHPPMASEKTMSTSKKLTMIIGLAAIFSTIVIAIFFANIWYTSCESSKTDDSDIDEDGGEEEKKCWTGAIFRNYTGLFASMIMFAILMPGFYYARKF